MNIYDIFETKKGLYYNVNKRKQAGTSRSKNAPEAPSAADWKNAAKTAKEDINKGIEIVYELSEGAGQQLSVQQLAAISDTALDSAYGYGRSTPGNTFGWQANLKSASFAKQMIDKGITDVEAISDAIHKGWNVTAQAFVKNPMQFDDSNTMAPEKLQAKLAQRQKLMTQQYAQLPEDEKEKDRVVARAMLQAINGEQSVAEAGEWPDKMSHDDLVNMQKNHQKWSEQDTPSRTDPSATVEDFYHEVIRLGPGLGRDLLYFAAEEGDEPRHIVKAARQLYKKIARKAGLNPEIGSSDNNEVFDLMYDWVRKNYSNPGVAETAPLSRDTRRERVAPTDRDTVRRELWKYVRSLDQEGMSNRAHAMAHSCPTWGRLYRQFNDDVSQLLSKAPTEQLAQALEEIQSKFQGVAEMDKSQKSPAGWNLDDYDYSKGKWTRGKIVTAKDAVKDMGNELNRAFNNTDPKDKEPGVTEADYEIHHHDPEGRLKARYHHGSEYTDDVIRKDADYHQKRNPKDTIKVFKDKKPMESQGVEESLRPGEYHVWTVHFEDGTKGRIRVPNDEITDDQIKAHYAKRGKTVVKVDADWAVHSLDEAPVSNFMTAPQQPIDPREQWKRQVRAMAAQYQRNPSMLASLAKEAGPDSVEQVAWEYLQSAAKGIRMPGADTQPAPVNWDDVIRRLPQGLSGQALLNAAEEYLTGTKGMLRSQVRTLLNEPTNQRSLKGAYDRKLQPSESIDELAEAIDSRLYAMKLAGYDIL